MTSTGRLFWQRAGRYLVRGGTIFPLPLALSLYLMKEVMECGVVKQIGFGLENTSSLSALLLSLPLR